MRAIVTVFTFAAAAGAHAADLTVVVTVRGTGAGVPGVSVYTQRLDADGKESGNSVYVDTTDASGIVVIENISAPVRVLFRRPKGVSSIPFETYGVNDAIPDRLLREVRVGQPDETLQPIGPQSSYRPPRLGPGPSTFVFPQSSTAYAYDPCCCPPPTWTDCGDFNPMPVDPCGSPLYGTGDFAAVFAQPVPAVVHHYPQASQPTVPLSPPSWTPQHAGTQQTVAPIVTLPRQPRAVSRQALRAPRRTLLNPHGPPAYRIYGDWVPRCERDAGSLADGGRSNGG